MLIDLDNILFNTNHIAAVKPSGIDSAHSIIFTIGQSAVDGGFLVHVPYKKVCQRLREIRMTDLLEMVELMDAGADHDEEEEEDEQSTK